jgi:hypothetical protein
LGRAGLRMETGYYVDLGAFPPVELSWASCRNKVEMSYFGKIETLEESPLSLDVQCRERCSPSRVRVRRRNKRAPLTAPRRSEHALP